MDDLRFAAIKVWPDGWLNPSRVRHRSLFDSTYTSTVRLLGREVDMLRGKRPTVQLGVSSSNVRQDGQLRANTKVDHPGVIFTFDTGDYGALVYSTDRFTTWHDNLRAIALGLESLRRVERYGIADRGQQYAGFGELGSGIPLGASAGLPAAMSKEDAARILIDGADGWGTVDELLANHEVARDCYHRASKIHHPDTGGDEEAFKLIGAAWLVLNQGHRDG